MLKRASVVALVVAGVLALLSVAAYFIVATVRLLSRPATSGAASGNGPAGGGAVDGPGVVKGPGVVDGRGPRAVDGGAPSDGLRLWQATDICLVDANGDGTLDVAGFMRTPNDDEHLVAAEGKTGAILWETPGFPDLSKFFCGGGNVVLVASPGFDLEARDAHSGASLWTMRLRDGVSDVLPGGACAEIVLLDREHLGVELGTGASTACKGDKSLRAGQDMFGPRALKASANGVDFELTSRASGTRVIHLAATSRGRELWSKEIDAQVDVIRPPFFAALAGTLVVFGSDLSDRGRLIRFGFDPTTGNELYRVLEDSNSSGFFNRTKEGTDRIYAFWRSTLHVYDPKTGTLLWRIGAR